MKDIPSLLLVKEPKAALQASIEIILIYKCYKQLKRSITQKLTAQKMEAFVDIF